MKKTYKRIWNCINGVIMVVVVLLVIALIGVRFVGLQPYVVLSGSMEPTYHVGSMIYVKSVDYKELYVGDPITYLLSEDVVSTHRIVGIYPDANDPETLRFETKGDANEDVDSGLVHYKNIIGKPVFTIPYLGYFFNYIQSPPGIYVAIVVGVLFVFFMFLPEVLFGDEKKGKKKKQNNNKFEE